MYDIQTAVLLITPSMISKNAIKFHQQGLSIAKKVGKKNHEGDAYICLGDHYRGPKDFGKAIE